ncbi:LysR family transcriptional regulator [Oceanidesulfovibrio indonesiensis]|uniref:LysR family transcriptional regulator n=1 Tax=Oceanidesulfovibrio indonesiensis TaxID=54767 RepID=A0A7M3MHY0_9BACT|nr:LysR family transcriptional regulator [Oceanidesulfovibrio indonesiensis]
MKLPVDLLQTFIAVADSGGFTKAAEAVNRTQSAVSQQIKRLEEELGRELFHRQGRAVRLSAHGETLLPYARRILHAHEEAFSALAQPDMTGLVRLGAPDDYAAYFLPGILTRFAGAFPRVQVEVRCDPSSVLLGALARGEVDLVVSSCSSSSDTGRVIAYEPVVWVTSAGHLAHEQTPVPLAVFQHGCLFRHWGTNALSAVRREYRIAYSSPSINGIQAAVSAGLAVAPIGVHSMPPGSRVLTEAEGFPMLPTASIVLHRNSESNSEVVDCLAEHVAEGFRGPSLTDAPPDAQPQTIGCCAHP